MSVSEQATFLSLTHLSFTLCCVFHFISHTDKVSVTPPPLIALKDDQGVVRTTNQITGKVGKRGKVTCEGV